MGEQTEKDCGPTDTENHTTSGPHSRACGWQYHPHGSACSPNCPTCGGRPLTPENVECQTCGGKGKVEGMNHGPADLLFDCPACSTPENVETPQCFCADIGESCDICTPENVEEP